MTTAIALETSRGDLALALGLGIILLAMTLSAEYRRLRHRAVLRRGWRAERHARRLASILPLSRATDVTLRRAREDPASDGVSFTIDRGRRTIILGPNGCRQER